VGGDHDRRGYGAVEVFWGIGYRLSLFESSEGNNASPVLCGAGSRRWWGR